MKSFSSIHSKVIKKANAMKKPKYKFGADVTKKMNEVEGNIKKNVSKSSSYKFGADVTKLIKQLEKKLMKSKAPKKELKTMRDAYSKIYSKK